VLAVAEHKLLQKETNDTRLKLKLKIETHQRISKSTCIELCTNSFTVC